MKKFNKIAVILAILSISVFIFAGCGSTSASSGTGTTGGKQQGKTIDKSAMEKNYKDKLATLVKASTINQDQSNKILTALTARFDKKSQGNAKASNSTSSNQVGNKGGQGAGSYSPLSTLVSQKVITQAQADTVTKSVMGNRQNGSNRQNGQANQ